MGSNPSGGTKTYDLASTYFQNLLNDIGSATFYLNTIAVGLDAVENGHEKPSGLVISWEPKDRIAASRMARKFAVESTIVRVAEGLMSYITDVSALPRFNLITVKWNRDTGGANKLYDIASDTIDQDEYLIAAGMLLIGWRNQIVHRGKLTLKPDQKILLRKSKLIIFEKYNHLDIEDLLNHVHQNKPTLKDVSSLTAMTINLARAIDDKICTNLSKADVIAWLDQHKLRAVIKRVRAESAPEKLVPSIKRVFQTNAPKLYREYLRFFAADGSDL